MRTLLAVATAVVCLTASVARAQDAWPSHPVRVVVPFAPGGPPDLAARLFAAKLQEKWGQSVIVDNRPGGAGNIGAAAVARAEPDGYTILVSSSALPVNVTLFEHPGYALSDFQTAAVPVVSPNLVIANKDLKQNTLSEFLAAAKTEKFAYASAGIGTTPHLSGELIFTVINKLDVRHVPFAGGAPAVVAVMGGQTPVGVVALPGAIQQIRAGQLRALASTTEKRLPELPDVPTVKEAGGGDVVAATSVGFYVPAKTPASIVNRINADINEIVSGHSIDKELAIGGFTPMTPNPAQAQAYVEGEMNLWAPVIKAAGIKPE